eukprot:scaffold2582_cov162-Ochromonas_danica.AAC.18
MVIAKDYRAVIVEVVGAGDDLVLRGQQQLVLQRHPLRGGRPLHEAAVVAYRQDPLLSLHKDTVQEEEGPSGVGQGGALQGRGDRLEGVGIDHKLSASRENQLSRREKEHRAVRQVSGPTCACLQGESVRELHGQHGGAERDGFSRFLHLLPLPLRN